MKRKTIKMTAKKIILEEGYKEVYEYYMMSGSSEGTLKHIRDAYKDMYNSIFNPKMYIENIDQKIVNSYINLILNKNISSTTKEIYIKDFKRIIDFFIKKEYMEKVNIIIPKVSKNPIETYTDEELQKLLKKPVKNCTFATYRTWVTVNFLLSTGVRLSSLINIHNEDIDFDNNMVYIRHTKNKKPLIIPLNRTIVGILKEYMKIRQGESNDYLFCNTYGDKLTKGCLTNTIVRYNLKCGVKKRGIHRFRHTFAKKWILSGGSVVTLQKILGHSSLRITEQYLNILTTDLQKDVEEFNILKEFNKQRIKLKK